MFASWILAAVVAGYPSTAPCFAAASPYGAACRAPLAGAAPHCLPTIAIQPGAVAFAPTHIVPPFAAGFVAAPPRLKWWDDYDAAVKNAVWASKPLVIWFDEFDSPQWATQRITTNLKSPMSALNATLLYVGNTESGKKIRERFGIPMARAVVTLEPSGQYQWFQWAGTIPDSEIAWLFGAIGDGKPAFGTTTKSPHSNTADAAVLLPTPASAFEVVH